MSTTPPPSSDLRPVNVDVGARLYMQQMWERRHLAVAIPLEDIRASHQNTVLGNIWHLGNPLLTVFVYYVIFGQILNTDRGVDNYILWLMIGVFAYHLTSKTVLAGARSISSNQGLMRSIRFPRMLLPISVVVEHILTFAFELLILALVAVATGAGVSTRWLFLPVVMVLHTVLNMGGSLITARLNDSFQDIQQIIPFLFRLGTYASGVMFPIQQYIADGAAGWYQPIILYNPIAVMIDLYRWVFMAQAIDPARIVRTVVISVLLLVFGFRFFRAAEHRYGRAG